MAGSFAAEFLKLRKRRATWVLGSIWLAFLVLFAYVLPYLFYTNLSEPQTSEDLSPEMQIKEEAASEQLTELTAQLYPENMVSYVLSSFPSTGGTLALILGVLIVGSEYGWGTLKTALSQRPSRLGVFFAKMLTLAAALALFVVLAFVVGAVCSLVVALLQDGPVELPPLTQLLGALGAGGVILAVWAALGVFLATLFRSTALAIGLGLFYALVLEGIVIALLISNEAFQDASKVFLGPNSGFLASSFAGESDVGAVQAALVLCAYLAAFVLIAALVFRQRDVT